MNPIILADMVKDIASIRREYTRHELSEDSVLANPFEQFDAWFHEAVESQVPEPNAMSISTVDAQGRPSSRIVLLKGFDQKGLVFYTNYESRKAREIENNPRVSLLFFWPELERQVRVQGEAEKISKTESMKYFFSRPVSSRIGAWASAQSAVIEGRYVLEKRMQELKKKWNGEEVPYPSFWGGFRIKPELFEFWQGRVSRLHDRIEFVRDGEAWSHRRLSP